MGEASIKAGKAFFQRKEMASCAIFALVTVYTLCMSFALLSCTSLPVARAAGKVAFYVSKNGNNSNGLSWKTAWHELDQINWAVIQPGDTIFLDGGETGMTYNTTLTVGKSGLPGEPITIARSAEAGHAGAVTFFGGRSTPLPYCGQTSYSLQTAGVQMQGIDLGNMAYVVIDGGSWHGITITGYNGPAVSFGETSQHDTLRNLHIYDDGNASQHSDGTWSPEDGAIIVLHGNNHVFQYMDIHDGEEDAFQPIDINNITVQYSWLHDSRPSPVHPAASFNQCNHNDGMQIWTGNAVSGLVFDHDVFGPEKEEDLILGNGRVKVSNVRVANSLFISAGAFDIWGSPAENWTIDHITAFAESENLILDGSGHSVTSSIFYGGLVEVNSASQANNCQWNTTGNTLSGQTADPQFVSNLSSLPLGRSTDLQASPQISTLANLDFALRSTSPCRGLGSPITSVRAFLQLVQASSQTLATPVATSSAMVVPTLHPVVVATSPEGATGQATPAATNHPLAITRPGNETIPLLFLGLAAAVLLVLTFLVYRRLRQRKKKP
jgi:hypothetical protein